MVYGVRGSDRRLPGILQIRRVRESHQRSSRARRQRLLEYLTAGRVRRLAGARDHEAKGGRAQALVDGDQLRDLRLVAAHHANLELASLVRELQRLTGPRRRRLIRKHPLTPVVSILVALTTRRCAPQGERRRQQWRPAPAHSAHAAVMASRAASRDRPSGPRDERGDGQPATSPYEPFWLP